MRKKLSLRFVDDVNEPSFRRSPLCALQLLEVQDHPEDSSSGKGLQLRTNRLEMGRLLYAIVLQVKSNVQSRHKQSVLAAVESCFATVVMSSHGRAIAI